MGDRGINFHGFAGDAPPLFRADRVERAHIVHTVGQFDQDNANVARHGQQHFTKAFCLLFGFGCEFKPV